MKIENGSPKNWSVFISAEKIARKLEQDAVLWFPSGWIREIELQRALKELIDAVLKRV